MYSILIISAALLFIFKNRLKMIATGTPTDTGSSYITSEFNEERTGGVIHKGIDIGSFNKPIEVYSPVNGKVIAAGTSSSTGTGKRIWIKDDKTGLFLFFAHLSKVNVKAGNAVFQGQIIGKTGDTGAEGKGIHLHFELRKDINSRDTAINPKTIRSKYMTKAQFLQK
jgi:murein DD-endopeptidase MepM/ murein hydrolase activator NlpD